VRQFEMPNETSRVSLDRMCSAYGFVASKFLFAFQTRELRGEVKDFRAFRNRLVGALSKKSGEFAQKLADLRANGKAAEANLLVLLRELRETSGPHLQARHWKLALEETSKMAMTHWKSVIAEAKKELADTLKRFHDQDRHYAYWLLCGINRQFFELLDGKVPLPNPDESFDRNYCLSYDRPLSSKTLRSIAGIVRRTVNRIRRESVCYPRTKTFHNRIDFDSSCYTVRSTEEAQFLELMSLEPGKRICLRLKGKSKIRGTLQLIRDTAGTYSLRVYVPQQCEEKRKTGTVIGIDLGYTEMMATSEQELLGTDLGKYFSAIADKRGKNSEGRNRMHSLFRHLLKKSGKDNLAKAERIRKHNLGRKKQRARYIRDIGVIKTIVNRELNLLFTRKTNPIKTIVVEDLSARMKVHLGKKWNRRLSGWMRGYLQERIRYKAKKHGIEVSEVNPAHSSRECPRCHCTDKKNRQGDVFKCSHCGYHGHADLVAALNILGRLGDKEIRKGMSPSRVKAVLDGRYVGWKSLNHTVTDRTSGEERVVDESPRSASSKSELRSNVQVCIASR
jgi:putative transposase